MTELEDEISYTNTSIRGIEKTLNKQILIYRTRCNGIYPPIKLGKRKFNEIQY